MEDQIRKIDKDYLGKIKEADSLKQLDELYLSLFGKNGQITNLPKQFPNLSKDELKVVGPLFNKVKVALDEAIEKRRVAVKEASYQKLASEKFNLKEQVVIKKRKGHLHPNTQFIQQIVALFEKLGFQQFDAPHIDTDFNNFEVLNMPQDHPARDLWDTFYIDSKKYGIAGKLLLRTHTSNSQIHIMKQFKPPIRMMSLGRCFRYENLDVRHEHTFDQFELVYIDKGLTMSHLQYLSEYFLKSMLGQDIKVRLRPKYYPFTEPSVGFDGLCIFCKGEGCPVCANLGWLEVGGGGMIHPMVLRSGGIDPKSYSGIAWGPGLQRLMMLKWGIEDVRLFLKGDLKFLERF